MITIHGTSASKKMCKPETVVDISRRVCNTAIQYAGSSEEWDALFEESVVSQGYVLLPVPWDAKLGQDAPILAPEPFSGGFSYPCVVAPNGWKPNRAREWWMPRNGEDGLSWFCDHVGDAEGVMESMWARLCELDSTLPKEGFPCEEDI